MDERDESAAFERVDWASVQAAPTRPSAEALAFVGGGLVLLATFLYDRYHAHVYLVFDWRVDALEWLFLLGLLIILAFGVVPSVKRWDRTSRLLRSLLSRPTTAAAFGFVVVLSVVGLLGPVFVEPPRLQFGHAYTPPLGFTAEVSATSCAGEVTGDDPFEWVCHGTWSYPLGTNHRGLPLEYLLMTGARITLYVVVFTAAFIVPVGVATGLVAGLRGGRLDGLLMSYVDIQLSLPAILVYFIAFTYWNVSLLLLLVTFGLLSWGGVARLVRSEVLQRREEGHVLVARGLGAPPRYLALRHLLPNVTNTVVPATFHLLALLVLVEAGVAFLGFHHIQEFSWGSTIAESTNSVYWPGLLSGRHDIPAHEIWWASTFPAAALALTMLSFKLLGDGLRDALDPRTRPVRAGDRERSR